MPQRQPDLLRWVSAVLLLLLWTAGGTPAFADVPPPAIIVLDASGSMAARMPDHRTKLDAARAIVADTVASWPAGGEVGLIAYGHRRRNDCSDIQTILPLGPLSPGAVVQALRPLRALGMTPLSQSLADAAKLLPGGGGTIVLVSDGIETCNADPCAVAATLKAANAALVIHVVGFGVKQEEISQLSCIAERSGGKFFDAKDANGLTAALDTVKVEAAAPPQPPPPAPLPPPEPPQPPVLPAPAPAPAPVLPAPAPALVLSLPTPAPVPPKTVRTHLSAVAGALGAIVDAPTHWSVVDAGGTSVYAGDSRALDLDLLPGQYRATAAAANATGSRQIDVAPGQDQSFEVTVDAGRLDLSLAASPDAPPYSDVEAQGVVWTLEPLAGQSPAAVPAIAAPSLLLAPGHYRIRSELKGLKADAEFDVKAGEATTLALTFRLGTLDLEAVLDGTTDPLEDAALLRWRVGDGATAQTVEGQAKPKLTLPEGNYPVVLTIAGADVPATAEVKGGKESLVRVVVPGGKLVLSARLGPQSAALDNWHDTFWTIAPVETLGKATASVDMQEPAPTVPLSAGRWHVTLKSGAMTTEQDVSVAPGTPTTVSLNLQAGRLTMNATPADGAAASNVVYDTTSIDASGAIGAAPAFEAGSSNGASTILPAGHWRVIASDSQSRHAQEDIELSAGEEKSLSLTLK